MATEKIPATKVVVGSKTGTDGKPELTRLSYLHAFKPHKNQESGRHEFSTQLLLPKTATNTYAELKKAVDDQLAIYFPAGAPRPPRMHYPIKDGDTGVNQKGVPINQPGCWVISAKTDAYERLATDPKAEDLTKPQTPPDVVGTMKDAQGKLKKLTESEIKSGDWGRVSVNVKGYKTGDGGAAIYLNNIQKVQDGDPLGGGRKAGADEFAGYADDETDPLG